MSLAQFSVQLMAGSDESARNFVELLPDDIRLSFREKMQPMKDLAYSRMLRDPVAFMAFKIPTPILPLEVETFRILIDACVTEKRPELDKLIDGLELGEAYVVFSSASRLIQACDARPLLKGAPIAKSDGSPLNQSELF